MESTTGHRESIKAWKPLYLDLQRKSLYVGGGGIKIQKYLFDGITMVNLQEIKSDRIKEKKRGKKITYLEKKKKLDSLEYTQSKSIFSCPI